MWDSYKIKTLKHRHTVWQSAVFSSVTAGGKISRHNKSFSLFQNVQADSGAHPLGRVQLKCDGTR